MVAPARSRSPESAVESRPTMSALDRVLKAVRAGWTDYNNSAEASVAAQARFARRIGHGDTIQIEGETWRIIDITKGDDEAPVIIENGKIHRSIASLDLERVELAARLIRSVDEPEAGTPAVVPTGTRREPVVTETSEPTRPKVHLPLRYGVVDVSEAVEDRARDTAEESLHAEKKDAGFFAKIFKHNIAYEVYRQIAISRSRSKILSEKNLYASDNFDRDAHRKATGAVVDRFLLDHEEFLHSEGKNGEKKKVFGDSAEEKVVKKELEALVREYATNPDMDAAELAARRDEIFASANKLAGDAKGRGVMHADNLEKLADQVRQQAAHAGGLANLDLDLEIVIGKAKLGARTERDRNIVDKALEKLDQWGSRHPIAGGAIALAFRNEIAVALGSAYVIGNLVARTAMSSTAGKLMTFGGTALVSGAYGWWKEKGRLNSERSLHERQMSLGGETRNNESASELAARESTLLRKKASLGWWQVLDKRAVDQEIEDIRNNKPLQPRRKEMEGFELARESAKTLALGALGFLDASGKALRGDVSVADATTALADIEARIRISNKEKIDLLKYTNVAEAEVERRNLDMARMQLKAALRSAHDGAFSTADKKEYKDFQAYFDHIYSLREGALYGRGSEAQKQQKKFADWSQRVAVKRGLTTMAIGAGIGLVGHELWALGTGGDTTIGSTWAALKAYFDNAPVAAAGPVNVEAIGGGMFTTPPGTDLVPQADGSFVLESTADHSAIASGLHIDPAGHLDAASMATLRGVGANIVETDQWVNSSSTATTTEGTWDWLRHHFMQKIHRDNWMDNDTPMYLSDDLKRWLGADLNELKLEWGGIMGPDGVHPIGLDTNGQIVMTMGHMTPDGSFHDALSENAPAEIVERKVRLLLTMNSGSQNSAIELMSDQRGQFHIDPNSDIGKTFFRVEHGKVVPLYYHAEVGISKGFDASGVNHFNILATHIGKGTAEGITSTDIGECIDQHVTEIGLPTSHDIPPVAIPPFVPIRRRQPMEPLKGGGMPDGAIPTPRGPIPEDTRHPNAYYNSYYNGRDENDSKRYFVEMDWYRPNSSEALTKKVIDKLVADPVLSKKYSFVLEKLTDMREFDTLPEVKKQEIVEACGKYNLRYFGNEKSRYISVEVYVGRQITRIHKQIENILIEEASVGEGPFPEQFYKESPLRKGLERADEIVLMFNPMIGDSVLTAPVLLALDEYLKQANNGAKIVVVTKHVALFKSLKEQYGSRVELVAEKDLRSRFTGDASVERFIMNGNSYFSDYKVFGLSDAEVKDVSRVMSFDGTSWTTEEFPDAPGHIKKYDPMPARTLRGLELMLGQKLFDDIHQIDHFLEKGSDFNRQYSELVTKYNILPDESIIAISPGSSVTPKEWLPERWNALFLMIQKKYPKAHILWLEDPNAEKRALYGTMVDEAVQKHGCKVSRVSEGLDYMNTVMSMADLSITPDTGLGHLSGALGTKNVMLTLVNPVQWSTGNTERVMHRKAYEIYKKGGDTYGMLWGQPTDFYVEDGGKKIGASDIQPEQVFEKVEKILG